MSGPRFERLVTRMDLDGACEGSGDFPLNAVRDPLARRALVAPFVPSQTPTEARRLARLDLVLAADGRFERG